MKLLIPRSNYQILCTVVEAAGYCPNGVIKIDEIAARCGYDPAVVLGNFGFLTSLGVFTSGMAKRLSAGGLRLSSALRIGHEAEIRRSWRQLFDASDTVAAIIRWIEESEGVDKRELLSGLAALFRKNLDERNAIGLKNLVSVLGAVGYLGVDGNRVRVMPGDGGETVMLEVAEFELSTAAGPEEVENESGGEPPAGTADAAGVHLHFHIDPRCSPLQLDELLRSVARHLSPGGMGRRIDVLVGSPAIMEIPAVPGRRQQVLPRLPSCPVSVA